MDKIKILAKNLEESNRIGVSLKNDTKLLRENEYNVIIDANEQFIKERQSSNKFKLFGKIKMVFKNQYVGTTLFTPLLKKLYIKNDGTGQSIGYLPYDEFAFLRNDTTYEMNRLPSGNDLNEYNPQLEIKNTPTHKQVSLMENPYHNWGMCLSYVFDKDEDYVINYTYSSGINFSNPIKEGIPFRVTETQEYYILTSPVKHNMKLGEFIIISNKGCVFFKKGNGGLTATTEETHRTFQIESVGDEKYGSEDYVINIPKTTVINGTILSSVIFGKRCIDKSKPYTKSNYYVRKHKILTNEENYTLDKLGFESNIWTPIQYGQIKCG